MFASRGDTVTKRMVFCTETDKPQPNGYVVMPGALYVEDEKLAVAASNSSHELLGYASDFERNEETGEISFNITVNASIDLDYFELSGFSTNLVTQNGGETNRNVVVSARIRMIYLVPIPAAGPAPLKEPNT